MVMVLGHRGARGLWPENTIAGFQKAIALGVDMIEFDVHLSSDGVPVVMHDYTLDRTTEGSGPVAFQSAADLSRIAIKDCEETVATFSRVLAAVAGSDVQLAIEIKTGPDAAPYPSIERKVLEMLGDRGLLERALILSFVPDCLERARTIHANVGVMGLIWRPQCELMGGLANALDRVLSIPGSIAAVQEELLTHNESFCFERVPAGRLAVGVNNDPARMAHWLGSTVRHISTDRPDLALELRRSIAASQGARLRSH